MIHCQASERKTALIFVSNMGALMSIFSEVNHVRRGDICLLSPDRCMDSIIAQLGQGDIHALDVAVYRLDQHEGSHAVRPYEKGEMHPSLTESVEVLSRCRSVQSNQMAVLLQEIQKSMRLMRQHVDINTFDDVLMLMQASSVLRLIEQCAAEHAGQSRSLQAAADSLGITTDANQYGYLINVVAHDVLKTWGEWGTAERFAEIDSEIDLANVNVFVIPTQKSNRQVKVVEEDPILAVLEQWVARLQRESCGESSVFIDPSLYPRLNGFHVRENSYVLSLEGLRASA